MIEPQDEGPLESDLLEAAKGWHEPPAPPRQEMWREIQRRRQARRAARPEWRRYGFPLGVAALIAIGIGLGRWTAPNPVEPAPAPQIVASAPPAAANNSAIRVTADEHLVRTEAFLTDFRASARSGATAGQFAATSRSLLVQTRLLLDAPTLTDPRVRGLLQDLELILVQIAQLNADQRKGDVEIITNGLNQRDVLPRLRTAIPAGPALRQPRGES
ncbi:MAG TPA: hypothetical protein VJN95_17905 [Gemmatimonadales bacterium]|nr:hypothetical protein [Gemmatimonadales bacterium]